MTDHCIVIAGKWTFADSRWIFDIDKSKMSCIVYVCSSMPLLDFQNRIVKEFFSATATAPSVDLSYWPPNTKELATWLITPPVTLSHFMHLEAHRGMNLFVSFDTKWNNQQASHDDENLVPLTHNLKIATTDKVYTLLSLYTDPSSTLGLTTTCTHSSVYTFLPFTLTLLNGCP